MTEHHPVLARKAGAQTVATRIREWFQKHPRASWAYWAHTKVGELFGADLRSLAALRVALAAMVIADIISRWPDLRVQYTEAGVMPRSLVVESFVRWRWSLSFVNDTYEFQAAMFLLTIAAASSMLLGFHTRVATVVVWVLVVSLQARNPLVLSGADSLLRLLLFWSMFLPLGAIWSIDARRQPVSPRLSKRFLSFGTIGIFLQICFVYWFTAALKTSPAWRTDGTALYYALHAGHITRPFGEWLGQFPELLRAMTHASLGLEVVAPILLFSPIFTGPVRTFAVASVIGFHTGIFLTMDVGIFPWTSALAMTCFLPAWFWDTLLPRGWAGVPTRLQAYMRRWQAVSQAAGARWGLVRSHVATAFVPPLSSEPVANRFAATQPAAGSVAGPQPDVAHPGERTTTLTSWPVTNLLLAGSIVFVLLWNLTSVTSFRMPSESVPFAYASGLYQQWNMFAPGPSRATVWIVVRGVLADGREVDLLTPIVHDDLERVPVLSWAEPDDIVGEYYGSKYWRKYLTATADEDRRDERRAFAAYACRTWNGHYGGDVRLVGLQVIRMSERTVLPGEEEQPTVRNVIAQYHCT
jgi:hypothetical protein